MLNILVLYFHHIFPQSIQPKTYFDYQVKTYKSFTFIEEIKQLHTYSKFLILFDVTSLFTNILLEGTINIAIDAIFENYPNVKFTRNKLEKLFKVATSETHFIFNNEIYDQIDGVSMGSSLAPILANLFMGYHEKHWIKKAKVANLHFIKDLLMIFLRCLSLN